MPRDKGYPALSIRQPFADLVVMGVKDIENRGRPTRLRGTILIHAGRAKVEAAVHEDFEARLRRVGLLKKHDRWDFPYGAIIGMADIVDCVTEHGSEFFNGPYGWVLANAEAFARAVPYTGKVGIFYVPSEMLPRSVMRGRTAASH